MTEEPAPWHVELWATMLVNPTRAALFFGGAIAILTHLAISLTPIPNFGGDMPTPLTAIVFGLAFSFVWYVQLTKPY